MKVARALNVSDASVFNWENGVEPKASYLVKLADFFGCTTDELLGRENYGTGNVEIIGERLKSDEQEIIDVYRALNVDGKKAFLSMVKNLAMLHNVAVKIS
ncbi:MAG: helix-turn-helix domain-containing protein [Corallococcus sp.]|nr:helix-turn-helix domain-containing protein [Corallococcus sp.]